MKRCKKCGGTGNFTRYEPEEGEYIYLVECENNGSFANDEANGCVNFTSDHPSEEEAHKEWNKKTKILK
jgi:hypothetical protein